MSDRVQVGEEVGVDVCCRGCIFFRLNDPPWTVPGTIQEDAEILDVVEELVEFWVREDRDLYRGKDNNFLSRGSLSAFLSTGFEKAVNYCNRVGKTNCQ